MSKAEKYIEENTRNCINTMQCYDEDCNPQVIFKPWLTSDQAREAVEIAREEIYEWLNEHFFNYFEARKSMFEMCLDDLKQAMKDE